MKKQVLASVFLATIIWAVFGQTFHHGFVNYDDDAYVYENPLIAGGLHWHAIAWVFAHSLCSNWHPVTWVSHMLDCQLYGLHPGGHHLTSVLLHTATVILLFLWLEKFTCLPPAATALATAPRKALWRSVFVAAVFAIHPLRVESVAWVAERKDVLSGLFFMLTLWAYAKYVESRERRAEDGGQKSEVRGQKPEIRDQKSAGEHPTSNIQQPSVGLAATSIGGQGPASALRPQPSVFRPLFPLPSSLFYLVSLFCFALGLMSKPMLVTLPFVLLLLDYWPLKRFAISNFRSQVSGFRSQVSGLRPPPSVLRPLLLEKLPFLALAVASCVVTVLAQEKVEAGMQNLTVSWRVENALVAYLDYLGQMAYPAGLAVFYPLPATRPSIWLIGLSVLVLAGISWGAIAGRRKRPWLLVGWLWNLGMMVPVIGLVQVGAQARADRYTYLPQIGLCLLVVWGAAEWCETWRHRRIWVGGAGGLVIGALIATAYCQTGYWKDSVSLWTHTLACTSGNWVAHENLGNALFKQKQLAEAVRNYEQTVQLKPNDAQAYYDLGIALAAQGDTARALEQYERALEFKPDYADAHVNIGNLLAQQGRLAEAREHFQQALEIKPDHAKAHVNLANVLSAQGQWTEAVEHYQRALQIKPDYTLACFNLGNVLASHGKLAEAAPYFQRALTLATAQGNLPLAEAIRNRLQSLPQTP